MATSSRKATDLERLTQPGGKVMPDDATIPVLTERLTLPSLDLDISLPQPPPPVVAPLSHRAPPPPPASRPCAEAPPAVRPAPPPSTLFAFGGVGRPPPVFAPALPPAPAPAIATADG